MVKGKKYEHLKKKIYSIVVIYLALALIFPIIQILPNNMKLVHESSADSAWHQTNWSAPNDYISMEHLEFINNKDDIKLPFTEFGMVVSDQGNNRIVMTDINGSFWYAYGTKGSGVGQFEEPRAVCYDNNTGDIYVGDYGNYRIMKTKIDGSGWMTYGTKGSGTGQFGFILGLDYDSSTSDIYVSSYYRIIKTMMNGSGWTAFGSQGNGTGEFDQPCGLYYDSPTGFIYVADFMNNRIVKTKMNGSGWTTLGEGGTGLGQFDRPCGIHYDADSEYLYVADTFNHRIVKTKMDGSNWTTYGTMGSNGEGQLYWPRGIQYDNKTDFLYITDANSHIIKTKMNGSGWTTYGQWDNTGKRGTFYWPSDIALFYDKYLPYGSLESRCYDFGGSANLVDLSWSADTPTNTAVEFQLRTGANLADLNSTDFVGPNGSTRENYTMSSGPLWSGHDGDRWVQYKVFLSTLDYTQTPVLKDVKITYNLLPDRPIILGPENNTVTNDNTPTFTWQHIDLDSASQNAYQWQLDNNEDVQSVNYDSKIINSSLKSYTPTTPIEDGIWYWHVRTRDSDGGWGEYSAPRTILIDTRPPGSKIIKPENGTYYKELLTFQGTAMDYDVCSGVNRTEIAIIRTFDDKYWSGSEWVTDERWLSTDGLKNWQYNSSAVTWTSGNEYLILSRTYDNATNLEIPGPGIYFNFDTDAPVSVVESPINNSAYNKLQAVTGSAHDIAGAGVKCVELRIKNLDGPGYWDGGSWTEVETWLATVGTTSWSYDTGKVTWASGCTYLLTSRATDTLENIEKGSEGASFLFDNTQPGAVIEYPAQDSYLNKLETIIGTAIDINGSGIENVFITIMCENDDKYWTGAGWQPGQSWLETDFDIEVNEWSYNSSEIGWTCDNYYSITPRALDGADNFFSAEHGTSFMYDDQPPVISVNIDNGAEYTKSAYVELSLDSQDTGSNTTDMAFSTDGSNWTAWEHFNSKKTFSITPGDGEKYVYFIVRDRANNTAESVYDTIILDTTPPAGAVIINDNAPYTNSKSIALKITCSDLHSGIKDMSFSADNVTWSAWETFTESRYYLLTGDDGEKFVFCRIRDLMGNTDIFSDSIILDTTPPSLLEIEVGNVTRTADQVEVLLRLHAVDALSGVGQMSFSTDYQTWTAWENYIDEKTMMFLPTDDEKVIFFKVRDRAGNEAEHITANINLTVDIPGEDVPVRDKSPPAFDYWIILPLIIIIIIVFLVAAYIRRRKRSEKARAATEEEDEAKLVGQTIKPQQTPALFTEGNQSKTTPATHQLSAPAGAQQPQIAATPATTPSLDAPAKQPVPQLPPAQQKAQNEPQE